MKDRLILVPEHSFSNKSGRPAIRRNGVTILEFMSMEQARQYLRNAGYKHTSNSAGESNAEIWEKD